MRKANFAPQKKSVIEKFTFLLIIENVYFIVGLT